MSENNTPPQYLEELITAGVPASLHPFLGSMGVGALVVRMGIVFTHMSAEQMSATMPVAGNTQIVGLLHGGAHLVLAETLGSFAAALHAGPTRRAVGIEIGATHHRGVREGLVTGTARALHLGRSLATHEVLMHDAAGRLLSTARITNMILDA